MIDLTELKTLSRPVRYGEQIYFLQSRPDAISNDYQTDLYYLQNGQTELVYEKVTELAANSSGLYFQAHGQIYRLVNLEAQQLTRTSGKITSFSIEETGGIYYVVLISDQAPFNTVAQRPKARRFTKLHYKDDGVGFIDETSQYELHYLSDHTDNLIMRVEQPIKVVDARTGAALVVKQANGNDDLVYQTQLLEIDRLGTVTELPSGEVITTFEATYNSDGSRILFVGADDKFPSSRENYLYLLDVATGQVSCQFASGDLLAGAMSDLQIVETKQVVYWLDQTHFAFTVGYHGHTRLYHGEVAGQIKLIRDEPESLLDTWFDEDGTLAVRSGSDTPSEIIDLENGNVLYRPNTAKFIAHEKYEFKTTNGDDVDGWFMPADREEPAPVILYVHGGPHAAYGEGFFWEFQNLALAGNTVVYINPHGSTTYGQEFMRAVVGHYGEQDYEDVLTGLDVALEKFADKIDASRQYMLGGSYGGFMTTWAAGHTDRFKAIISQRPVTNWVSLLGQSDIGYFFVEQQLAVADPYTSNGVLELLKRSHLTYAGNVVTPILLFGNEYDLRTPIGQAEEFYTAVKHQMPTTPIELVRFPQSWHGLSRNGLPNLRQERLAIELDWLNRYR